MLIYNPLLISIGHVVADRSYQQMPVFQQSHGCLMLSAQNMVSSENELGIRAFMLMRYINLR